MRFGQSIIGLVFVMLLGGVACGGSNSPKAVVSTPAAATVGHTAPASTSQPAAARTTPAGTPASAAPTTAAPAIPAKLIVTGGPLGATASATMHTAAGAACTIAYIHPSGKLATASGLDPKTAGPDGVVSWSWIISTGTKPLGTGKVTVTCGSDIASVPIMISPTTN